MIVESTKAYSVLPCYRRHDTISVLYLLPDAVDNVQPRMYSVHHSILVGEKTVEEKGLEVVVVSSMPRSGSTLLAQILASTNNSVLFFEPLSLYRKVPCFQNGSCVPRFIESLFECTFDDKFDTWLKGKGMFVDYYHPSVARCFQWPREGSSMCRRQLDLRALCGRASIKVVKLIRARLAWMTALLDTSRVKIIHLTRDPRGALASISRMGWNASPSRRCADLNADLDTYVSLRSRHPRRVIQVSLEELSSNPAKATQTVFHFLFGSSVLGETTQLFLSEHTNASHAWPNEGNMDTHRNSPREAETWRRKVSARQLHAVEQEPRCRTAIARLGHAPPRWDTRGTHP